MFGEYSQKRPHEPPLIFCLPGQKHARLSDDDKASGRGDEWEGDFGVALGNVFGFPFAL
jgi:hypothetical protein